MVTRRLPPGVTLHHVLLSLVLAASPASACLDAVGALTETSAIEPAVRACAALLPSPCATAFRKAQRGVCTVEKSSGPERRAAFRELLKPAAGERIDEVMAAFDVLDRRRDFPFSTPCAGGPPTRGPFADKDVMLDVLRRATRANPCPPGELFEKGHGLRFTVSTNGKVCRLRGEARSEPQRCFARYLERLAFPQLPEGQVEFDYPLNVDAQ